MKRYNNLLAEKAWLILLVIFFLLTASALIVSANNNIKVTILLFSGRPDPTFTLCDEAFLVKMKEQFDKMVTLQREDESSIIPTKLGYKGIMVSNPLSRQGLPKRMNIYNGLIELNRKPKVFLKDADNKIERLLMQEAINKEVLDPKIIERMNAKQKFRE